MARKRGPLTGPRPLVTRRVQRRRGGPCAASEKLSASCSRSTMAAVGQLRLFPALRCASERHTFSSSYSPVAMRASVEACRMAWRQDRVL